MADKSEPDPVANRRAKLVSRLEEQKRLLASNVFSSRSTNLRFSTVKHG